MPDDTGHYREVADDTIGRPPLFLIVFSFFSVGETSPGNKKPIEKDSAGSLNRFPKRRGRKMKTSAVGIVPAAILMVVTGVGFGIAQAGGTLHGASDVAAGQRGYS